MMARSYRGSEGRWAISLWGFASAVRCKNLQQYQCLSADARFRQKSSKILMIKLFNSRYGCSATDPGGFACGITEMPAQKSQHFVARCALKPFSLNGEGAAINLHNLTRARAIPNAPVKGQCARDYLYGKEDLRGEQLLARLEGQYARILRELAAGGSLLPEDKEWMRIFALIQWRRTEMAIQQMREWRASMDDAVFRQRPEQRPADTQTDADLMRLSLRMGIQMVKYVKDLKLVIFRNGTNVDFITCDNPAVLTNRFHFERLKRNQFGVSNSGMILAMPLTPRLAALCYDSGVYSIPNASGTPFVDIKREGDVDAINQLQHLAASKNIYFSRWEDRNCIAAEAAKVSLQRAGAVPKTRIFVRDHTSPHDESYRSGTPGEELAARESIVATGQQYPEPSAWPSQLKFRDKPKTFSNGTAAGYVRQAEWLTPEGRSNSSRIRPFTTGKFWG